MSSHVCNLSIPHEIHYAQDFLAAWAEASRAAWAVGSQEAWEGVDSQAAAAEAEAEARCTSWILSHLSSPGK